MRTVIRTSAAAVVTVLVTAGSATFDQSPDSAVGASSAVAPDQAQVGVTGSSLPVTGIPSPHLGWWCELLNLC